VVVTVDSVYGLAQLKAHAEARKQAAVADVLLITKPDLANAEQIHALENALSEINPGATQYQVVQGHIDPSHIIEIGLFDSSNQEIKPERWLRAATKKSAGLFKEAHDEGITSFTIALPMPLNYDLLEPKLAWLCATHGEQLLRMKGIIHADDQPEPIAVHAVHKTLYTPTMLTGWKEEKPISRLVLIGKGLDEAAIRNEVMRI
jgi:G3E family GTPase